MYTNFGHHIEIKNLLARYYVLNKPGTTKIQDGDKFWGRVDFEWQSPVPFDCTYGFYLNVDAPHPRTHQYTFGSERIPLTPAGVWQGAYLDMPATPFKRHGLADGRSIDTRKEIWLGKDIDLGKKYTVEEWRSGTWWIAAKYGVIWDASINNWRNTRLGEVMPALNDQQAIDWINRYTNWDQTSEISFEEWLLADDAQRIVKAERYGINRSGTVWFDSKSRDNLQTLMGSPWSGFTIMPQDEIRKWINAHKLTTAHRIASDGDADVYTIGVPTPTLDWIDIISAEPQLA